MRTCLQPLLVLLLFMLPVCALAQQDKQPRVLIIGDTIYNQHARGVTAELKGKAAVTIAATPSGVVLNSSSAIEILDQLLGRIDRNGKPVPEEKWPTWDLIHFNVGLGDLVHRVPGMKDIRLLPVDAGGVMVTGPEQYAENLDKLIREIKAKSPGSKLIWASTTPIRSSTSKVFIVGSEVGYNEIAAKVMAKHGVPINDMHAYAKSVMNMDKPASHGADPFNFDKKPIHPPVVEVICRELGLPMPEKEPKKERSAQK